MGYADDLDRFIEGQIRFEDIQGYLHGDIPIHGAIVGALEEASYYSEKEHDLYEKLCYAYVLYVLHITPDSPPGSCVQFISLREANALRTNWIGMVY